MEMVFPICLAEPTGTKILAHRAAHGSSNQFRTVSIHNEFVSDCGEWIVDVDHDGLT